MIDTMSTAVIILLLFQGKSHNYTDSAQGQHCTNRGENMRVDHCCINGERSTTLFISDSSVLIKIPWLTSLYWKVLKFGVLLQNFCFNWICYYQFYAVRSSWTNRTQSQHEGVPEIRPQLQTSPTIVQLGWKKSATVKMEVPVLSRLQKTSNLLFLW